MHDHILTDLSFFKQPITDDIEKDSPIDLDSLIDMKNLCYLRNGNETGLMVTAHTSYGTTIENRRRMLRTFLQEGMQPEKLLLCHVHCTFVNQSVRSFLQHPELCTLDLTWAKVDFYQ